MRHAARGGRQRAGEGGGARGRREDGKLEKQEEETHKVFDSAVLTVRSGAGGKGEVRMEQKGQVVRNFKYKPGGNMKKRIYLAHGEPVPGSPGGDVIVYADPRVDSLLHLRGVGVLSAPSGANADVSRRLSLGASGAKQAAALMAAAPEPLRIAVPPGTVVRRKRTRRVIAELTAPYEEAVVLRGGQGGAGVTAPRRRRAPTRRRRAAPVDEDDDEGDVVEDADWKAAAKGAPGEEASLELLLRVVADVGIVGLPSAGKSSLLAALTRAKPEVADYPFTTLIPNLGVMQQSPFDPYATTAGGTHARAGSEAWDEPVDAPAPVLADLPGLIEGAHVGRGLGRVFLRHLSRTRILLHCVDVGSEPTAVAGSQGTGAFDDYFAVREELRMYNPAYVQRTHVIALTKVDLPGASERADAFEADLREFEARQEAESSGDGGGDTDDGDGGAATAPPPSKAAQVIRVSASDGSGIDALTAALGRLTAASDLASVET